MPEGPVTLYASCSPLANYTVFFSAAAYPILLFVYLGADKNIYPVAASYHMNVEPL